MYIYYIYFFILKTKIDLLYIKEKVVQNVDFYNIIKISKSLKLKKSTFEKL